MWGLKASPFPLELHIVNKELFYKTAGDALMASNGSESTTPSIGLYGRHLEEGTWQARNGWD